MTKYLFQGEALNAHMLVVLAKNAYDSAATMHLFDLDALDDGESDAPNQATLCGFLPKGGLTEAAPSWGCYVTCKKCLAKYATLTK